jgi:hypothetical protein
MEEYLDSLSPEERKKVQDQLDNLDSDLFETTPEDLDAFVKEKFPNGRVLNGRLVVGNEDLGKVLDLYKADAYNNFLQGVGAEKFMQEIGVVNDPDITGSNVLDDMEEKKPRGGPRKYPSKYTWEATENGLEVVELRRSQFGDYRKFKSTNKGVSYFGTVDTPLFDSIEEANKNRPEVIETKLREKKKAGGPRKYPSKYGYIVNADNKLELKELRFFEASGTRKAGYRVSEFYPSGQIKQGKMYQGQLFDSVQEAENSFKNLNMNFNEDIEDALAADRANADSLDNYSNRAEDFVPESPASTDRINQSIQESQGASNSQISNASTRPTTRAMKFLKALDFLDPVEKVATGLLTALNLPNLARGYITYEVANLVGNLLMGGFKSTGDVQLMNSLILTGGSPEEIKAAKERIENTGAETLARIDKFSITGNIYEQIGKMLNR